MVIVEAREVLPELEVERVRDVEAGHEVLVREHQGNRVDSDADAADGVGCDHDDLRVDDRVGREPAAVAR